MSPMFHLSRRERGGRVELGQLHRLFFGQGGAQQESFRGR